MTSRRSLRVVMLLASSAMLAALAALGWLGTCARMISDDYEFSMASSSAMRMTWGFYQGWSGCYSSVFLDCLILPLNRNMVMLLPAAALSLWLAALLALFRGLLPDRSWSASLLAAGITLWATVDSTLSAGQSLYWAQGMFKYTGGLVALTFVLARIVSQSRARFGAPSRAEEIPGVPACALTALLVFLCGGFSETLLAVQGTAVAAALLLSWKVPGNRSFDRILIVSFVATMAAVLVVCLAPGNSARQGWIGAQSTLPVALARSFWFALLWTARFFLWKPATAIAVFAAGWLVASWGPSSNLAADGIQRRTVLCLLAAEALMTAALLPAAHSLSGFAPSRAWIVPQFVLVLAVLGCGWGCAALARLERPGRVAARSFQLLVYAMLIGAPLWSVYETSLSYHDAAQYAKLWDRRDRRLRAWAQAGRSHVLLDPLPEDLALTRGIAIPVDDPQIAGFYGFQSTREVRAHQAAVEPWRQEWWLKLGAPENFPAIIRLRLSKIRRP